MNGNDDAKRIPQLIVRLKDLICDIYQLREQDFSELLDVGLADYQYSYTLNAMGKVFPDRVFSTLIWFKGEAGLEGVLSVAEVVSDAKPKRKDLKALKDEIRAVLGQAAPADPAAGKPNPGPIPLPPDLAASLGLLDRKLASVTEFILDLRRFLRANDLDAQRLPARFHLSDSDGERLAAVLYLETKPDAGYLWWLAERVTVEPPASGFMAAQALIIAARRLETEKLPLVAAAVNLASDRLDDMVDRADAAPAYDVSTRKREILVAKSLVGMRTRERPQLLRPIDVDRFLNVLIDGFSLAELEAVCVRVQMALKRLARLSDPHEHVVVSLVVKAREADWERDLISAAFEVKPKDATLHAMHQQYVAPALVKA